MVPRYIAVIVLAFLIDFKTVKCKTIEISSYSQIANAGISTDSTSSNETDGSGVKIYKSSSVDLPDSLSVDESEATGRAFSNRPPYRMPFGGVGLPRPRAPGRSGPPVVVYPIYKPSPLNRVEIDKLAGKGQAMDRFFPGEAVASNQFKNKNNGYNYPRPQPPAPPPPPKPAAPINSQPPLPPASSFPTPDDYRPPKDLYSFPPNINSTYLPPSKGGGNGSPISSYLPPAAGPISNFPAFVGPVSPDYLPPFMKNAPSMDSSSSSMDSGMGMSSNGNGGNAVATPAPMVMGNGNGDDHDHDHDHHHHHDYDFDHHGYHYPVPDHNHDDDDGDSASTPPPPAPDNSDQGQMMDMNMPGDMGMGGPPDDHDHHHHHHLSHPPWDSAPSFYGSHGYDAFPEIIFDHDPHHDHHHIEHMTTTMAPEPPPEPRVKKYSYFYIGRKLWYVPLYFTVWFSFYIAFLILKSIARHTVNIPNHYQKKRSIRPDMTHKEVVEKVNRLTAFVLSQIDDFEEKYS